MAFDGNGNWISNFSAEADRDAGYKILASRFDNIFIADIAQSFENCLTKDAQVKPQTNFDANNYKIINVKDPTSNLDAVNLKTLNTKDGTAVHKTGTETISGNKTLSGSTTLSGATTISGNITSSGTNTWSGNNTFSNTITGSISGNAGTVTNGVYTTGNQTIGGNKTLSGSTTFSGNISSSGTNSWSGSNTFSGSVSLGALATATTPAYSDNDTSVATTAMVHNLNNTQRTNCITEIPQDIKLELSSGTLTLKAGSKVYVPNGSGTFNDITISTDLNITSTTNGTKLLFAGTTGNASLISVNVTSCVSGTSDSLAGQAFHVWYDTANNLIKYYGSNGSIVSSNRALPVAIITVSGGAISSIDQVFNGFGYIGSTIFALPNVKGLIPDGRNADGSLRNTSFTLSSVKTYTRQSTYSNYSIILKSNDFVNSNISYSYEDNYNKNTSGEAVSYCIVGNCSSGDNTGKIISFDTKPSFHAVDYYDLQQTNSNISTLDAQNVKLTGNQTIGGLKTLTSSVNQTKSGTGVVFANRSQSTSVTKGTLPTADTQVFYDFQDSTTISSTSGSIASLRFGIGTSGTTWAQLKAFKSELNGTTTATLGIYYPTSGSAYTEAPTPSSATDNSTKIATTAWVNSFIGATSTKATIASYAMPNYSAATTITSGWTATGNGWVYGKNTTGDQNFSISIDGTLITGASVGHGGYYAGIVPVAKNSVVTFAGNSPTVYFAPCKGG